MALRSAMGTELLDERTLLVIKHATRPDTPVDLRSIRSALRAKQPTEIAKLLKPFRASTRLWTMAKGEFFRQNTIIMPLVVRITPHNNVPNLPAQADYRVSFPCRKHTARQTRHLEMRFPLPTLADFYRIGAENIYDEEIGHCDAIAGVQERFPVLRSLVVDLRHDARMARPAYYNSLNGFRMREAKGYAADIAWRLGDIGRALAALEREGIAKYLRLTQVVDEDAERYSMVKIDGRKCDLNVAMWEAMDYRKCEIRLS